MKEIDDGLDVNFVANAGVKDIVGRGLIYDDNVAIIELVKNSKDAGSKSVVINFIDPFAAPDDHYLLANSEIIIKDFGNGMTREDIKNKWLNIAYSEKKADKSHKYAGNKGVGRFSCDRLGRKLDLYTKAFNDEWLHLEIDWTLFENKGEKDEISSIPLRINLLNKQVFLNEISEVEFNSGTVIKVSGLRTQWTEQKIKKLVTELEKFSPTLDAGFEIYFHSNGKFSDKSFQSKLNKKLYNGILDKLAFKTTYIKSSISVDGSVINTHLYYQGEVVFRYVAENPYSDLRNVSLEFHYLDTLAKSYFTKNVGVSPNSYGSIFLFYNLFRISPYGNEKNDWLGLDQRKSQGTSRNFGTRDVFGRVDIIDELDTFSVITSREGLAHNKAYLQLVSHDKNEQVKFKNGKEEYGFITVIMRQLENFVVRGLDWNRLIDKHGTLSSISADDAIKDPSRFFTKALSSEDIEAFCDRVLKSSLNINEFEVFHDVIDRVQKINDEKYKKFIDDFVASAGEKTLDQLSLQEKIKVKKLVEIERKRFETVLEERDEAEKIVEKTIDRLTIEKKKQAYLLSTRRTLSPDADGLIHTIKINNIEINEGLDSLIESVQYDEIEKDDLIKKLSAIKLYSLKSLKMAELATRSGFDKDIDIRSVDVVKYIVEYLDVFDNELGGNGLKVVVEGGTTVFYRSVSVLNLSIVLDNLLSNASKWSASIIRFHFEDFNGFLKLIISDNGVGLSNVFINHPDEIFSLGVRDRSPEGFEGSGIGLYYTRELLNRMNAEISFLYNNVELSGASFEVLFK